MEISGLDPVRATRSPFHSQGILVTGAHRTVYAAGQVGVRPDGTMGEGVLEQTRIAFENLRSVLSEGDLGLTAIVKLTIHLTDSDHIGDFVAAGAVFLPEPRPAATLLIAPQLANPDLLVQIEAVAVG